jgi:hypothetical protein
MARPRSAANFPARFVTSRRAGMRAQLFSWTLTSDAIRKLHRLGHYTQRAIAQHPSLQHIDLTQVGGTKDTCEDGNEEVKSKKSLCMKATMLPR